MNEFVDARSVSPRGLFLTAKGVARARRLHGIFTKMSGLGGSLAAQDQSALRRDDWGSFDDLYLGVYAMNLEHCKLLDTKVEQLEDFPSYRARASLSVLLDIDVPKVYPGMDFEATLIDETKVAQIARFRGLLEQIVPYPMSLRAIGLGCIYLEFSVYADPERRPKDPTAPLPLLGEKDLESSEWRLLRERFPIADVTVRPILK